MPQLSLEIDTEANVLRFMHNNQEIANVQDANVGFMIDGTRKFCWASYGTHEDGIHVNHHVSFTVEEDGSVAHIVDDITNHNFNKKIADIESKARAVIALEKSLQSKHRDNDKKKEKEKKDAK